MPANRVALPTRLPLFFLNFEAKDYPKLKKVIKPENGKKYKIQRTTPKGFVQDPETAVFKSKDCNCIISNRWIIKGRTTYVPHNGRVRILSEI